MLTHGQAVQLGHVFLGGGTVEAANFGISPLRAELSPAQRTAALTLRNHGDEAVVVQAQAVSWSQVGGQDVYEPTNDLIITPPIFTVLGGALQVVRVGLRRSPDAERELSYRVFLQEVPGPPKLGAPGVQMALRIGLPVFVVPVVPVKSDLRWRVEHATKDTLRVSAQNAGNAHVQIIDFRLTPAGSEKSIAETEGSAYLLTGQNKEWLLKPNGPVTIERLLLKARTDSGEITAEIVLEKK